MTRLLARVLTWLKPHLQAYAILGAALLVVATASLGAVLKATGGEPAVPLDDAYIHFQFARSFANFAPFHYTQGAAPVAGATSLLWPAILAPFFWLGVDGAGIVWVAWCLGFACLGLLAHETHQAARHLLSPGVAVASAALVLCFGGLVWLAASGMEALAFSWLWLRSARRLAEYCESAADGEPSNRLARELIGLSFVVPLARPEGTLVPAAAALVFALFGTRTTRWFAPVAALGAVLAPLCFWLGTGAWSTTTSLVKWLPNNPYLSPAEVAQQVLANLALLYGTLLNGEIWSASVLPTGGGVLAWLALPALAFRALRQRRIARGAAVLVAALGMWLPTTYDTFLWNRLRYLWPFAPAWFIGLGALTELLSDLFRRYYPALEEVRLWGMGAIAGALLAKLPYAIDDLAESSAAIRDQQVSLGRWAREHLPDDAIIGVNDTGAIAYFSERQTFDIVGLTTPEEGHHWVHGAGSRFEHYERLGRARLPTHFIVYPEWFALEPLLGERLTERYVPASILGGARMIAAVADYTTLGTGTRPRLATPGGTVVDSLDVADLVSEAAHSYRLFDARQQTNTIVSFRGWVDGARMQRTRERFELDLTGAKSLVGRFSADRGMLVSVSIDGRAAGELSLTEAVWQEPTLELPGWAQKGRRVVELVASGGGAFGAMHYWATKP